MLAIFIKGFALSATLIIAIGLQNAFILRQGIKNRHIFITALTAATLDALLIGVGVLGFGAILENAPNLITYIKYAGAAFLIIYGAKSAFKALKAETLDQKNAKGMRKDDSLKETILILLGVSLLNPHVYLDTVILLGGIAASYADDKYIFGLGAATASFAWFFSLAYGARMLAPLFAKPKAWQILDILIAIIMFAIAASLLLQ